MREVRAGTKGGPHDGVAVYRCIGNFGISVFHRPRQSYRPEASSLSRVRGDPIFFGEQVNEQSVFNLISFVVMERNPTQGERET
jgi:hypothetical protein